MEGKSVAASVALLWSLGAAACSEQPPRVLRADRLPPTYVRPADRDAPWLTIDIDTDHAVRYRDKVVFDPAVDDASVLPRALRSLRDQAVEQGAVALGLVFTEHGAVEVGDGAVRLEAHEWAEWAAVADLMHVTSRPEIASWQRQMALLAVPD